VVEDTEEDVEAETEIETAEEGTYCFLFLIFFQFGYSSREYDSGGLFFNSICTCIGQTGTRKVKCSKSREEQILPSSLGISVAQKASTLNR
jgi:hypothetical protein